MLAAVVAVAAFSAAPRASGGALLRVPADLAATAKPIWHADPKAEFVMARSEFTASKPLRAAVAFVTAELSPFCQPDARLVHNDYGACLPRGGTSQPKLLAAYKLFINGALVGIGPGRLVNATQGVDAIDVTSVVRPPGAPNAVSLEGFHKTGFLLSRPRMLLQLVLTHTDGSHTTIATGKSWKTLDATATFRPTGSSGAWAGSSGFPHEQIDMRAYPVGWTLPGFEAAPDQRWAAAAVAPAFVLPLGAKSALAARPIAVFSRPATRIKPITLPPPTPPSPPHPHHGPPPPAPVKGPPASCGIVDEGCTVKIGCAKPGEKIAAVAFASFGTVTGSCGHHGAGDPDTFKKGSCDSPTSTAVLEGLCVGKASCEVTINTHTFGEPCHRVHKKLAWDVQCKTAAAAAAASPAELATATIVGGSQPNTSTVIIDFGLEFQGGVNITFTNVGSAGAQINVKLSEELLPESCASLSCATAIKSPMRTTNTFEDTWTLRAAPTQTVMQHEYMEFRYAQVTGPAALIDGLTLETAQAWVIRYPLSDEPADQYGDTPTLPPSSLRPPTQLARFSSGNRSLDSVWGLVRHTLVAVSLDVNTDSNVRQRDLCHTDAYITGIGQLALSSDYGVSQMTAEDAFQLDSNIWSGTADFRAALVSLAYQQALYSGDLSLVRQRYRDMQMHSLAGLLRPTSADARAQQRPEGFFDPRLGLVNKSAGVMGKNGGICPRSWSPAGMPPGIYEALKCKATDLIDWPAGSRDGYDETSVGAVPNSYIALAAERLGIIAGWLGETADQAYYANVSATIRKNLRAQLYNKTTGAFVDGLGTQHASMHATLFATMAGAVDEAADPGMGATVVKTLQAKGMKCSCMAAHWLLEGLYKIGWETAAAADHALAVLTSTAPNSWLHMIAQGATASMEAWTREEKPNLTWSHPWCAGANSVIIRLLLGVQPLAPGWTRWQFAPQPASLSMIQATVPSLLGAINVTIANGREQTSSLDGVSQKVFATTLTVPKGSLARVCLPAAHGVAVSTAIKLDLDGVEVASVVQGRMLCTADDVKPGAHTVARGAK
jgi:hypothetical protein